MRFLDMTYKQYKVLLKLLDWFIKNFTKQEITSIKSLYVGFYNEFSEDDLLRLSAIRKKLIDLM